MDVLGRCLVVFGILSLLHAGFSTIQYRTYLKLIEEELKSIPIDVSDGCLCMLSKSKTSLIEFPFQKSLVCLLVFSSFLASLQWEL